MQEGLFHLERNLSLQSYLKHLKDRAGLVKNEFGEDLTAAPSRERENVNRRDQRGRNPRRLMSLFGGV